MSLWVWNGRWRVRVRKGRRFGGISWSWCSLQKEKREMGLCSTLLVSLCHCQFTWCHPFKPRRHPPLHLLYSCSRCGAAMSDGHSLKDPSALLFEQSWVRRWIFGSYLALVLLGLPLWWRTTSIERLSLPTIRVDALSGKEVRPCAEYPNWHYPDKNQAPFTSKCRG
jgi:hypothetical protein